MKNGTGKKLIAVETSSSAFSVAACAGGRIAADLRAEGLGRPSTLLADMIQQAAKEGGFALAETAGFAVSIGPGSFTGLRVGVTTVKTLAWALKKPVLPVSSLEVIAHNAAGPCEHACIFVDARKNKVYTASFSAGPDGSVNRLSKDLLGLPEEALKKLPPGALIVGDGIRRYQELIRSMEGKGFLLAPESAWVPLAVSVCRIALSRWPAGILDDPHPLVPQYLYSKEGDIA